ncbi:MAG: single-stranded DNA-binding protein [Verrucomicrobiales bacterium]|nr:single-stranded DNA-binding protein [Verrucomicrobiales bacterium]
MASLNKVMLMGNLTRDPEVRYTPKGTAVTDLGLAINRNYTTDGGEKREETTFVDITFWGRQAETLGQYMKKGRPLYVEGRMQLDTWDDKTTGQKRSKLKVVGENFQFLGGRDDNGGGGGYQSGGQPSGGGGYQQGGGGQQDSGGQPSSGGYDAPPSNNGGDGGGAAPAPAPTPAPAPAAEMEEDDIPF